MFVQLGLQLKSDMSIRIYSDASIAENPLLVAVHAGIETCFVPEIRMNEPLFDPWPMNIDLK